MTLIQQLNGLRDKSPDEIAMIISDPLRMFVKCNHVTQGLLNAVDFRVRPLAYFRFGIAGRVDTRNMCWNNGDTAQNTLMRTGTRTIISDFSGSFMANWAIIGYEHRLDVDPFAIDWETYDYTPYP